VHPVFNRYELNYDSDLEVWLDAGSARTGVDRVTWRALAFNVIHDFRVQPERQERFHAGHGASQPLHDALVTYFKRRVRFCSTPDFADPALNDANIVAGAYGCNVMDQDTALVTFLDLNGLVPIYQWAKANRRDEYGTVFDLMPNDPSDVGISAALQRCFDRLGSESTISGILAAKAAYRQDPGYQGFHPTWAGLWDELGSFIALEDSDRWNEMVGVVKSAAGRWIAPLKYTAFEAGTIARPTILDANANAWHFPSPPSASLQQGGCCMDLRATPLAVLPVHEFVHQEIDFMLTHWHNAGSLCKRTNLPGSSEIEAQRLAHHALLKGCYGGIDAWMPVCV